MPVATAKKAVKKTASKPVVNLGNVVDKLGQVKADLSDLKKKETEYRDQLVAAGITEQEGKLFRATVSTAPRNNTDWKAVLEHLEETDPKVFAVVAKAVQAHTEATDVVTVKVVSR